MTRSSKRLQPGPALLQRSRGIAAGAVLLALLAACAGTPRRPAGPPIEPVAPVETAPATPPPPMKGAPPDFTQIPDAVPKFEPRSKRGNPPFYNVLGRRYSVLGTADGYSERGVASWYGPGFHLGATSIGDAYDMYGMTAAHKTLPLPCYARVTNLSNGKSVVVRINDRGPFVANRLIDLSWTAAAKLDMLRQGTALVEVKVLNPGQPDVLTRANEAPPPAFYVQAGAFASAENAQHLQDRMRQGGIEHTLVVPLLNGKGTLYRVRVGPIASVADFDRVAARLNALGIPDVRLAND